MTSSMTMRLRRRLIDLIRRATGAKLLAAKFDQLTEAIKAQHPELHLDINASAEYDEWDSISGRVALQSFRPYILHNNTGQKLSALQEGLDERSRNNAETYLTRILNTPDISVAGYWKVQKKYWDSLSSQEYRRNTSQFGKDLGRIKQEFRIVAGGDCYSEDVFWYHHGLRGMPQSVKDYIKNKDFIDGGAFVGDSALVFLKYYFPRKVYSFEISPRTVDGYLRNMRANHIPETKYEIVPYGLSNKLDSFFINDTADQGTNLFSGGSFEAKVVDLDSFADEHDLQVGFIKSDVEGAGLLALEGMKNTIKRDRPVVCLAIYHSPEEYFELKPMFEKIVDNYKLSIVQLNSPWNNFEIVLLGYPGELERDMGFR